MRPPDGYFLFGRVISIDANLLGFGGLGGVEGGLALIYIYAVRAAAKMPVPMLVRELMLIPPRIINKKPWTRGYFEHLENRPIVPMDRLPQHCFVDACGKNVDEMGRPVSGSVKPMGVFGVDSFRTIDDDISKALGIPLAPD